jgi:hypothetical protein
MAEKPEATANGDHSAEDADLAKVHNPPGESVDRRERIGVR